MLGGVMQRRPPEGVKGASARGVVPEDRRHPRVAVLGGGVQLQRAVGQLLLPLEVLEDAMGPGLVGKLPAPGDRARVELVPARLRLEVLAGQVDDQQAEARPGRCPAVLLEPAVGRHWLREPVLSDVQVLVVAPQGVHAKAQRAVRAEGDGSMSVRPLNRLSREASEEPVVVLLVAGREGDQVVSARRSALGFNVPSTLVPTGSTTAHYGFELARIVSLQLPKPLPIQVPMYLQAQVICAGPRYMYTDAWAAHGVDEAYEGILIINITGDSRIGRVHLQTHVIVETALILDEARLPQRCRRNESGDPLMGEAQGLHVHLSVSANADGHETP
mmetsp:Transcript_124577/g.346906  ORF Transcript_124577/g.346906 Transcript_124577/m.346906 type:complete len:331 (-) Transcript_124577:449-1441(-)